MSVISSVLSRHNKDLNRWTLKPSVHHSSWTDRVIALASPTDHVIALRQISVTALCYSSVLFRKEQENTSSRGEGMPTQRHEERERDIKTESVPVGRKDRPGPLAPLFICFFLTSLGLPYVNWASQECCLFYLRSSLPSSDLPLTYCVGFSLPCLLATTILDSCFLF